MTPAKSAGPNRCDFRLAGEICWSEDDRLRAYRASVVSVRARHTGGRHARTNSWLLPLRTNLLCRRRKIWTSWAMPLFKVPKSVWNRRQRRFLYRKKWLPLTKRRRQYWDLRSPRPKRMALQLLQNLRQPNAPQQPYYTDDAQEKRE